jgi:hypothetical protein
MSARVAKNVKSWRRRFKERIRIALGNKCASCGYFKYEGALDIHHLLQDDKEISFAKIYASPKAAISILAELRKCVLLCKVCHVEVHAGVRDNPEESSFDEATYLALIAK